MYTPIKELLIKIRKKKEDSATQMAKRLGCSYQFLFFVENGKNMPPESWQEKLTNSYNLNIKEQRELKKTIYFERNMEKLNLKNFNNNDKLVLLEIAYSLKKYKSKLKQIIK